MTAEQHPPTRASLRAWWQNFTSAQKSKAGGQPGSRYDLDKAGLEEHPVFGKPLKESLKYASVQISTANSNGELYVWGYIPVVVAKCGLFLKENATEVEGTFRVNGSNKRMRDLQALFESPPRYGKSLDWKKEQYTAHDVASVFRRYLTQMPEPVIPYNLYFDFRNAIAKKPYNQDEVIATYKRLIHSMPRANQYLLLYVLDLLSVFARKAEKNLMTAQNLAVIFRPGIMSHPDHELTPKEHQLSQEVVEFLIAHQDWFMLDIPPPPPENYNNSNSNANSPYYPNSNPNSNSAGAQGNAQGNHNNSPYGAGAREDMEDVVLVSSSEDEGSPATTGTGGWKLVGGRGTNETSQGQGQGQKRVARRRTMNERDKGAGLRGGVVEGRRSSKDLSPVAEAPSRGERGEGSPIGVTRSRTLPSTRSGRSGHSHGERGVGGPPSSGAAATTTTTTAAEGRGAVTDDEHEHEHERHGRVLKKPRPSSAQPQAPPPSSTTTTTTRGKGAKSPGPVGVRDVGAPVVGSLVGSANAKESTAGGGAVAGGAAGGAGGGPAPPKPIEGVPGPVLGS